jgi:glycosyltransferase involved in cell wall biosynthesis
VGASIAAIARDVQQLRVDLLEIKQADGVFRDLERIKEVTSAQFDEIGCLRRQLEQVRCRDDYAEAFEIPEPLVSVRIATYGDPTLLIERAIASVIAQTYQRFEIIVVGDFGSITTEKRISEIGDPRIRYLYLPVRAPYPDDQRKRWQVAGSQAMNLGIAAARGHWIAPLDHDDEFVPSHIETLLHAAQTQKCELVYGKALAVFPDDRPEVEVGSFPPRLSAFGFQAALYLSSLKFFDYNPKSWVLDEPGDWNLCRRMLEAGVRMGFVDEVVTRIYPSWSATSMTEPQTGDH